MNRYTKAPAGLLDLVDARTGLTETQLGFADTYAADVLRALRARPGTPIPLTPSDEVLWLPAPDAERHACRGCGATLRAPSGACAYCGGMP